MSLAFFRSSKGQLLFALRGRIPRTDFWVGLVVVACVTTLAVLLHGNRVRGGALGEFFTVVTAIAVLSPYCLTAIVVKRLHDLDMSGWNVLSLFLGLLLAALATTAYWWLRQGQIDEEWQAFWTVVLYVTAGSTALLACFLAYFIGKLGFAPGTSGTNRFGPDPLALVTEYPLEENAGRSEQA